MKNNWLTNFFLLQVAVKIMDVTQIKENYVVKNLYREAKILSKLKHPCIVSLFQTMQVIIVLFELYISKYFYILCFNVPVY